MISCDYYQELISRLVDGEISHNEHEALMAHLNTCSRCNAMYAVFHDLSDILAEEPDELPEGLHENIMAGVRRSEIIRKNRRLRKIGLRTALTAAACAVLVLFAAAGFGPGKRAESVSIRSEEEARQVLPSPTTDAYRTEAPAAADYAAPAQSAAPMPVPTWAPVSEASPAGPDAHYGAGADVSYTAPQPEQYIYTQPVQTPAPAVYQTQAPADYQTPAPFVHEGYETPTYVLYQTPAPVVFETPTPVVTPEPAANQTSAQLAEAEAFQAEAPAAVQNDAPLMRKAAPAVSQETPENTVSFAASENMSAPEPGTAEPAAEEAAETAEEAGPALSLFSSVRDLFDAAEPNAPTESQAADMAEAESFSASGVTPESAPFFAAVEESAAEEAFPVMEDTVAEDAAPAETAAPVSAENVSVRGKELRVRLLAMIGQTESALPSEAELTRLVHVTLIPEDEYASEEKLDFSIYGDFVYCQYFRADGSSATYRADCSLRSLDDFLKECRAAEAAVTPAPTVDPYAAMAPQA